MISDMWGPFSSSFRICIDAEATTPASSCSDSEFLEQSVGQCIPCDGACAGCYGPSALDCACCRFGDRDSRGACPISLDGIQEGQTACTFRTTQVGCSVGWRKLFVAQDERLVSKSKRKKKSTKHSRINHDTTLDLMTPLYLYLQVNGQHVAHPEILISLSSYFLDSW